MRYIICYDVSDDRRRSRLANTLLDFGHRLQESVFTAELDGELHSRMAERVRQEIGDGDRLMIVPVCAACQREVEAVGQGQALAEPKYYVI